MKRVDTVMRLDYDDIYNQVHRTSPKDWSVVFLWTSIFLSVTMISGTLMWNLGKGLRTESYLKEQSVQTCAQLHQPPARMTDARTTEPLEEACAEVVARRHARCLERTLALRDDLDTRRHEYMTCIMEQDVRRASLDPAEQSAASR